MLSEIMEGCTLCPERAGYPKAGDSAWERIPAELLREIRDLDREYLGKPYPMRLASAFMEFSRSGSRRADEEPYFLRRRKLCVSALASCTGEDRLNEVIDGIWCICEETSWVISAHNGNSIPDVSDGRDRLLPDPGNPYVDLFSAQTAMILSHVCWLLEKELDRVSSRIRRRVYDLVCSRVLVPFLNRDDFWWMGLTRKNLNNWTPWIVSNILAAGCLCPLDEEDRNLLFRRSCIMLDRYLNCLPDDGGCDEGPGYWNVAGGSLLDCLEVIGNVTGKELPVWKEEKIRNILCFPMYTEISPGWFANFADCNAKALLSGERLQLAGEKIGNEALTAMGLRHRGTVNDQLSDVPHLSRVLSHLFHPAVSMPAVKEAGDVWYPDLQWRIVRRGRLVLCAKGGHNGESHNHNDVGSFMLYLDGEPLIVDAGNMTYTAKTFSEERYTLWNTRSAYHNLPVIGGAEQAAGKEYRAGEVRCLPDGISLRLEKAYPLAGKGFTFRRTLEVTETELTLRDEMDIPETQDVSWIFLLRTRPEKEKGGITSGPVYLEIPEDFSVSVEEIPVTDQKMAENFPGSLWRLLLRKPVSRGTASFRFRLLSEKSTN